MEGCGEITQTFVDLSGQRALLRNGPLEGYDNGYAEMTMEADIVS